MSQRATRLVLALGWVPLVFGLVAAPSADAALVTLTDQNSVVEIDADSQAGAYNWVVDGVDQLFQQWFWYRIGDDPAGQQSIDAISDAVVAPGFGTRGVELAYSNNDLAVSVSYLLTGGSVGSNISDVAEAIRLTNNRSSAMTLHFFQYSDFDLGGDSGGQTATIVNPNKATQTGGGSNLNETVVLPNAARWEAGIYSNTLNSLNSGALYNLNNNAVAGPGDATWAYQWTFTLNPGGSALISKDKQIQAVVPEPSMLVAFATAAPLLGLGLWRRRKTRA